MGIERRSREKIRARADWSERGPKSRVLRLLNRTTQKPEGKANVSMYAPPLGLLFASCKPATK